MKYFIIAGEASGDLHGAKLVESLLISDKEAVVKCWGGDKMQTAGAEVLKHISELAFMGFVEVLANIGKIIKNFKLCKTQIDSFRPDIVIFIDYPGFNLKMAKWTKEKGYLNAYYIAPQAWAWKEKRVDKIREYVDQLYAILPFEEEFFTKHKINVKYIGHPLLEQLDSVNKNEGKLIDSNKKIIALLPGSRKQEIKKMLVPMINAIKEFDQLEAVIAGAPNITKEFYQECLGGEKVNIVYNKTYQLFNESNIALVTSGTATLEAALFRVPQIVMYRGNPISYFIAKQLVKIKYVSLVNLILDAPILVELIQKDVNQKRVVSELTKLVTEEDRNRILHQYEKLNDLLDCGGASNILAQGVIEQIKSNSQKRIG